MTEQKLSDRKLVKITKLTVGIIASAGAGMIIGNAIKLGTPINTGVIKKLVIGAGGLVMSSMVGDAVQKYTDEAIDDVVENFEEGVKLTYDEFNKSEPED